MKSLDVLTDDIAHLEVHLETLAASERAHKKDADHFRDRYRNQQGSVFAWSLSAKEALFLLIQAVETDGKIPYEQAKKLLKSHAALTNGKEE